MQLSWQIFPLPHPLLILPGFQLCTLISHQSDIFLFFPGPRTATSLWPWMTLWWFRQWGKKFANKGADSYFVTALHSAFLMYFLHHFNTWPLNEMWILGIYKRKGEREAGKMEERNCAYQLVRKKPGLCNVFNISPRMSLNLGITRAK